MKKWSKPQLLDLSFRYTELGGLGGQPDSALYQVFGFKLIGTSGPAIDDPNIIRIN
jgi:hypothetical protein